MHWPALCGKAWKAPSWVVKHKQKLMGSFFILWFGSASTLLHRVALSRTVCVLMCLWCFSPWSSLVQWGVHTGAVSSCESKMICVNYCPAMPFLSMLVINSYAYFAYQICSAQEWTNCYSGSQSVFSYLEMAGTVPVRNSSSNKYLINLKKYIPSKSSKI